MCKYSIQQIQPDRQRNSPTAWLRHRSHRNSFFPKYTRPVHGAQMRTHTEPERGQIACSINLPTSNTCQRICATQGLCKLWGNPKPAPCCSHLYNPAHQRENTQQHERIHPYGAAAARPEICLCLVSADAAGECRIFTVKTDSTDVQSFSKETAKTSMSRETLQLALSKKTLCIQKRLLTQAAHKLLLCKAAPREAHMLGSRMQDHHGVAGASTNVVIFPLFCNGQPPARTLPGNAGHSGCCSSRRYLKQHLIQKQADQYCQLTYTTHIRHL